MLPDSKFLMVESDCNEGMIVCLSFLCPLLYPAFWGKCMLIILKVIGGNNEKASTLWYSEAVRELQITDGVSACDCRVTPDNSQTLLMHSIL